PPTPKQEQFLENDPLMPTPEPLLTQLIREIQHEILVEEPVIRRIYHALLAGHVILSGPPGTGKTHLARLIPEILWKSEIQTKVSTKINNHSQFPLQHLSQHQVPQAIIESIWGETVSTEPLWDESVREALIPTETTATQAMGKTAETVTRILTAEMAYTTHLVTATDEWSVRTLISGITPVSKNGNVTYEVQDGHLTAAIKKNWSTQSDVPENGETPPRRRSPVTSNSGIEPGTPQTFRGQWLVIDEFNRAPIDLALGDALTALGGGNDVLGKLPIPKDFRIIGTLNSFDRNYLNQISEALKRRFSFVEILPPGRSLREAEQAIVLYKSLQLVSHLSKEIISEDEAISWGNIVVEADSEGQYSINWPDEPHPFQKAFEAAWCVFEVIRIYRQLGTAQAISLVRHMLIAGILQGYTTREEWIEQALDAALCDTIADQLQVLLPDEIEALLLYLTSESSAFGAAYNQLLSTLANRRLYAQLFALGNVSNPQDQAYLSNEKIEAIAQSNPPTVATEKLTGLFHLAAPAANLPQFKRRLRTFKAERGL
ncbi:MAG: AAA family ATPase, partial [Ktedonobacteraceae bacterium]